MRLTINIDISKDELLFLRENSLERVLNEIMSHCKPIYLQDLEDCKSLASRLWACASSEALVIPI